MYIDTFTRSAFISLKTEEYNPKFRQEMEHGERLDSVTAFGSVIDFPARVFIASLYMYVKEDERNITLS